MDRKKNVLIGRKTNLTKPDKAQKKDFRKPLPKRNNIGSAEKSVFYYTNFQKRGNAYEGIKKQNYH